MVRDFASEREKRCYVPPVRLCGCKDVVAILVQVAPALPEPWGRKFTDRVHFSYEFDVAGYYSITIMAENEVRMIKLLLRIFYLHISCVKHM